MMYLLPRDLRFYHFSDSSKQTNLQIELAAIIDFGEPFVKATYRLEGDGPLALEYFKVVEGIAIK